MLFIGVHVFYSQKLTAVQPHENYHLSRCQSRFWSHYPCMKTYQVLLLQGGCADSVCQVIPLLFMALGQKDVSKIQLGELTEYR